MDKIRVNSASSNEQIIAGYKVKVNYTPSTKQEQKIREEAIAKIILGN